MGNRMFGYGTRSLQATLLRLPLWLVAATLLVTFSAACADQLGASAKNAGQVKQVQGQEWHLESLRVDGNEHTLLPRSRATLQFQDDGSVTGVAFINRFFGKGTVTADGALTWGDAFGATKMAGPPELMELEQLYLSALPKTRSVRLDAGQMLLESEDGTTRLQFRLLEEANQ